MLNNVRILVADDDKDLTSTLSEQLKNEGYDVVLAFDGDEAMAHLKKMEFTVVILDLKMPKVHGFDILIYIKENLPKTKVIVLTGYADLNNVT
jgi:DNA-binding NtrC family response regulator